MNQARMLQQAMSMALRGERVLVSSSTFEQGLALKKAARTAIADAQVLHEKADQLVFHGGGELLFKPNVLSEWGLGFSGSAYIVSDEGDDWSCTSNPPPVPRTRFERVIEES